MKHDINGSTLSLPSVSLRGCQLTFQLINQQEFNPFYKRSLTFVDEFNSFFLVSFIFCCRDYETTFIFFFAADVHAAQHTDFNCDLKREKTKKG